MVIYELITMVIYGPNDKKIHDFWFLMRLDGCVHFIVFLHLHTENSLMNKYCGVKVITQQKLCQNINYCNLVK